MGHQGACQCGDGLQGSLPFPQIWVELGCFKRSSVLSLSTRINPQNGIPVVVRSMPSLRDLDSPPPSYRTWFFCPHTYKLTPNSVGLLLLSLLIYFAVEPLFLFSPLLPGLLSMSWFFLMPNILSILYYYHCQPS